MPTTIIFASAGTDGKPMRLIVEETPDDVFESWQSSQGRPVQLTANGAQVWVNPASVVFWRERGPGRAERQEEAAPAE